MWLDLLASKPKVRLLRYLASRKGEFSGLELARATGMDAKRTREALADMVRADVVTRRTLGRASLYALNHKHYIVESVLIPAFRRETEWLEHLGRSVLSVAPKQIMSVVLYGSWARGDARPDSDVDLLVIVAVTGGKLEAVEQRLNRYRARAMDRFGRPVSFLLLTARAVADRIKAHDKFIREVVVEGRVLAGRPISEVIRPA